MKKVETTPLADPPAPFKMSKPTDGTVSTTKEVGKGKESYLAEVLLDGKYKSWRSCSIADISLGGLGERRKRKAVGEGEERDGLAGDGGHRRVSEAGALQNQVDLTRNSRDRGYPASTLFRLRGGTMKTCP